jgi:predicted transcriptional regulator
VVRGWQAAAGPAAYEKTKVFVDKKKLFVYECVYIGKDPHRKGHAMARRPTRSKPPRPTDAELAILRTLWRLGPSTVRQVHEAQAAAGKRTTFNTTLKMLRIMFDKGLVTRQDARRPHVYQAAASEARTQQHLVRDLLDRAFGGAAGKLVAALTATNISEQELAEIRRLLDEQGEKNHARAD